MKQEVRNLEELVPVPCTCIFLVAFVLSFLSIVPCCKEETGHPESLCCMSLSYS